VQIRSTRGSRRGAPSGVSVTLRPVPAVKSSRLDASDWQRRGEEPDGLSQHLWLKRLEDGQLWLFKPVEVKGGHRQGEDWAEKAVSELATVLGVPCARIELAIRDGIEGLVSRDVKPRRWDLQPGAAVLDGVVPGYESRTRLREGHTIENIQQALRGMASPPGHTLIEGLTAYDTFCGYLTLDALVANRDRHDHNWAVVIPPGVGSARLAASFDHASSLGFSLRDERRRQLISIGTLGPLGRARHGLAFPAQTSDELGRNTCRSRCSGAHDGVWCRPE